MGGWRWLWVLALALGHAGLHIPARAADVSVLHAGPDGRPLIVVTGDLEYGDEKKFIREVIDLDQGLVLLHSGGGNLAAGLDIGKAIRLKNFGTVVAKNLRCASSCALAWLGGRPRWMESNAAIGFHAAYRVENGSAKESGAGNALIGAYLANLGLSDKAILYITSTPPEDMEWLSIAKAKHNGIEVGVLDVSGDVTGSTDPDERIAPSEDAPPRSNDSYEFIKNADVVGEDLGATRGGSVESCHADCKTHRRCGAFTFDRWNRVCFLKAKPTALRLEPRATSGVYAKYSGIQYQRGSARMSRYRGKRFPGGTWKTATVRNFPACETACARESDCVAFTFDKRARACALYDYAGEYSTSARHDSGVKSQPR